MSDMKQFSFQGKIYIASRDANGNAGPFLHIGDAPSFELSLNTQKDEQYESTSGRRQLRSSLITQQSANISLTLNDFSTKNLALGLYGTAAAIAAGSVTDEALPDNAIVGDLLATQQQNISSLVVKDSAGSPATLVLDTDYKLLSAAAGMIEILDLGSYVQPFTADYSYAAGVNVAMFTQAPPIRWLRVHGKNTADSDKEVVVDLYNVELDPFDTLPLINDAHGSMNITGSVRYDSTKETDTTLGQIGRIIDLSQPSS